ncbi:MAG: pyridoxamine 5-phosphate oxidase, partial [Oricola sp.]|nr:pyridoxamine 5-phosphate oxidase [Oricola sp.]
RRRLKLLGHARIVEAKEDPGLIARLSDASYQATPERAVVISVAGYDWNCPQHITERYTKRELAERLAPVFAEMDALKAENEALKKALASKPA